MFQFNPWNIHKTVAKKRNTRKLYRDLHRANFWFLLKFWFFSHQPLKIISHQQGEPSQNWWRNQGKKGNYSMDFLGGTQNGKLGSGPRYQILSQVFAHCASQKTHWHARIARKTLTYENCRRNTCNSRMSMSFLTHATCKKVWHNSYTLGHCLWQTLAIEFENSATSFL